jgi:peptidyl-prolyl cis-trans isomerase C
MSRTRATLPLLVVLALAAGCARDGGGGARQTTTTLRPGVVARVGAAEITADTVERIARDQHVGRDEALRLAVRDALFASESEARKLASPESFGARAVLARALLRSLARDAERKGPITDAELREATERHWLELDRPDAFRTVHAVVRLDAKADASRRKLAADVADAIHRAVAPVTEMARSTPAPPTEPGKPPPEDPIVAAFRLAAGTVSHQGLEVVVEALPPVSSDGRVVQPEGGRFDESFARAASALAARGDLSAPTTSSFGVHVILLLDKRPGHVVPAEERRALLGPEIFAGRARAAHEALRAELGAAVGVDRSVDALLAEVPIEP